YLYFLREARIVRPGRIRGAKARDAVEGSLLRPSPSVAQALLFTLRNEGPVLLRSIPSHKHDLLPAQFPRAGSPLVAQAFLPVLLRPRLSLYRHLKSARTVSFGATSQ